MQDYKKDPMQQQTITGERIGTFFAILYNCDIITTTNLPSLSEP